MFLVIALVCTYGCKQVHACALLHGSCFLQTPANRRELLQKFPMALFAFSCTTEGWVLVAFPVRKTDCLLHVWENWSANIFCPRLPNSVRKLNCVQWRSYKGQLFFTCMMWHHTPVPHHWSLHWGLQVFPAWYSSQSFDHISVTEITCLKKWLCQYSLSSLWLCCGLRGCGWTP